MLETVTAWNTQSEKKTRSGMTRGAIKESKGKFEVYAGQDVSETLTVRLGIGDAITAISNPKERRRERERAAAASKTASGTCKKESGRSQHASSDEEGSDAECVEL